MFFKFYLSLQSDVYLHKFLIIFLYFFFSFHIEIIKTDSKETATTTTASPSSSSLNNIKFIKNSSSIVVEAAKMEQKQLSSDAHKIDTASAVRARTATDGFEIAMKRTSSLNQLQTNKM